MARDSSARSGFGPAWIGAAAALLAALIGAAAIVWQTNKTTGERPAPASGATQILNATSSPGCPPRAATSEIRLTPNFARTGDTIVISGNGFPGAEKVYLAISGPGLERDPPHIGTPALDSCGRFEYRWAVPPTLAENGGTRFRIDATGQDRQGRDIQGGANESNVEFTLVR
jgi:hypothetical protein